MATCYGGWSFGVNDEEQCIRKMAGNSLAFPLETWVVQRSEGLGG